MSEQAANQSEPTSDVEAGANFSDELPITEGVDDAAAVTEEPSSQQPGYESAAFQSLESEEAPDPVEPNLDVILNIPVTLSMEIGRTRMTIEELMRLNRGSVVKLERLAGEPMDVLVNGTLIAHGEVVVVNDKFGIRLIDVISPAERVKKLR